MSTQKRPSFGSLDPPSKTSFATCDIGPIDAVYTWVNGSDPDFVRALILERIKLSRKEKLDPKKKFEQKEDPQKKTRNENMSESIFDIVKKWTFRQRCLQKTRRKEYFYIQTQLIYLECGTSEDSGEHFGENSGEDSGKHFGEISGENSEPCSFDTIQNFVQKFNITLLDFSFQVNSSVNFDSDKGKEEKKKERERRSKKERKRFLLYSMEENSLNLGEFC